MKWWESITVFDQKLLQSNVPLTLHVVQSLSPQIKPTTTGIKGKLITFSRELSCVGVTAFKNPRSITLRTSGYSLKAGIKIRAISHQLQFFADVSDAEMRRALTDRGMLDYRRYRTFLEDRGQKIIKETVKKRIDFSDDDFSAQT